jgi:hypothetical protein
MSDQNFRNHARYLPVWHLLVPLLLLALLGGSINFFRISPAEYKYPAALLILVSVIFLIYYWYTRAFALRAQDRAIRAEERLRHYLLTGQPLDPQLRMGQIIALRFASDAEFPALAKKAVAEKMAAKEIKQAIQNWKADHNRV